MKLYTRKDFLKLPRKTIYSRVSESDICVGLYCKESGLNMKDDFMEQDLLSEAGFPLSPENGCGTDNFLHVMQQRDEFKDFKIDLQCTGRDGMFEESDRFVVYDLEDLNKLVSFLSDCAKTLGE